jgi:hypothetical protein
MAPLRAQAHGQAPKSRWLSRGRRPQKNADRAALGREKRKLKTGRNSATMMIAKSKELHRDH